MSRAQFDADHFEVAAFDPVVHGPLVPAGSAAIAAWTASISRCQYGMASPNSARQRSSYRVMLATSTSGSFS